MLNSEKKQQEKSCNCKNSKCMKLYCECFAAQTHCGKNCRCVDCHNNFLRDPLKSFKDPKLMDKRSLRDDITKNHKGCACRKSNCTKKYCECFQAGISCKDICKCIDCQNNESMTNKNIIVQLKKNTSQISNQTAELYPLYLSQNSDHLNHIISQQNPLSLKESWLQKSAKLLYQSAKNGSSTEVMDTFLQILQKVQETVASKDQSVKKENLDEESENLDRKSEKQKIEQRQERVIEVKKDIEVKEEQFFQKSDGNIIH